MKKTFIIILLLLLNQGLMAWGFYGHKRINRTAVFALPPEMMGFFKTHITYLTEHAVDPDKRRYSDTAEACRHYIDLDRYETSVPIDTMPHFWKDAVTKYSEDTLLAYGIVPWHIQRMLYRLTEAFISNDVHRILQTAAELGHYMADACVPLHSTMNYNGQLTGQSGIHGFWESRLPELYSDQYDFYTGKATYLFYPQETVWIAVEGSFNALDSVLRMERNLNSTFDQEKKFEIVSKGGSQIKNYSDAYSLAYHSALHGMVERRMVLAIQLVSNLWYTAWVDAGMPDLNKLNDASRVLKKVEKSPEQLVPENVRKEP